MERWTLFALALVVYGVAYRGYAVYSFTERFFGISESLAIGQGTAPAPFVYRVGVGRLAYFLYRHGIQFRWSHGLFDGISCAVAVFIGYHLLTRQRFFRSSGTLVQALLSVLYTGCIAELLSWQDLFKKTDTDPSIMMVTLMLWLLSSRVSQEPSRPERASWLTVILLLVVGFAQGLIRAEITAFVGCGVLAAAVLVPQARFSLSRRGTMAAASLLVALAVATQFVLSHIIFRNSHYAAGEFLMLHANLVETHSDLAFLDFMLPIAVLYWLAWRRRASLAEDAPSVALMLGALPFVGLWAVIGRFEEVRIFLPMAVPLVPLFCRLFTQEVVALSGEGVRPAA
ncbi:hypothetical protein ACFQBQ_12560 [Granulicella cerasi]|uniref:Glycosyltransferase RgtA/B/C/D-like domain-containing protein n=1 Tax=Granulicella cerasi TaxID=741063 RepID=A0ABW1ZB27_9BACT|nr:hypothetical protein [Granulicella cerasi]